MIKESYLTSGIGFGTAAFLPTIGVGDKECFFGLPDECIFSASRNEFAMDAINSKSGI